jgi:hypothetical protein
VIPIDGGKDTACRGVDEEPPRSGSAEEAEVGCLPISLLTLLPSLSRGGGGWG